jgi:ATP-dependent Clp protease ATP-binding subunit ClpC
MSTRKSLRVYFIRHGGGALTGILLRTWDWSFDREPPSAYGASEEDVYEQLEAQLHAMAATREDKLERYLWDESFELGSVTVDLHPETALQKRTVIGKRKIPLTITYLASRVAGGGYRVMVPRFGFGFIVEDLSIAPAVLRRAVSTALLGKQARSIYDFRAQGGEYVETWAPRLAVSPEAATRREEDERPTLRAVAEDLVEKASRQRLPMIIGEGPEDAILGRLASRGTPASVLLVGGPGVGKTTWVYRLARRLAAASRSPREGRRPAPRLWSTSADRILAGMSHLGMWQERGLRMLKELSQENDILHGGSLLALLRPQPDGSSLAELFAPAVRARELRLIVECTEEEREACERRAGSLLASFEVVRLPEMALSDVPALLAVYETRRDARVRLHPAGKKRLVQHLSMFQRDLCFPGKAIRFFDWLAQEAEGREADRVSAAKAAAPPRSLTEPHLHLLYPRDVSEAYARYAGLPLELIADEVPANAVGLAARLKERVIGQDAACEASARVLARFKAGLNDPERPAGALLFVGPTGVGKTELARELARLMFGDEGRMIRLDMSEYTFAGAASRLLEVGRGEASLAQRVRKEPLSLVLLDEIEKAHADVFDVLLAILGEGRLTDEEGRLVDFRMTLVVMTSNLGVAESRPLGFGEDGRPKAFALTRVREHFRPELWGRIDHVIPFRDLDLGDVRRIVDLEIMRAAARTGLLRKNLRLRVTPEARARLAELGYHPTYGARPLKRLIEERVITPIAARIAEDAALSDRDIVVEVRGAELVVL